MAAALGFQHLRLWTCVDSVAALGAGDLAEPDDHSELRHAEDDVPGDRPAAPAKLPRPGVLLRQEREQELPCLALARRVVRGPQVPCVAQELDASRAFPNRGDPRLVAENDVFVFDTKLNKFGRATASSTSEPCLLPAGCGPFPLNANLPQVNLRGDKVFVVGGEVDERTICGELYQHCA